jgi:two-component system, chemotaxis family, response regulator Rcp1
MVAREFHILLVEDNPADARLTLEAFRGVRVGTRISHVKDGAEALDFLRRAGRFADVTKPDLILLDLNLPRKDGREVLAEIKSDARLRHIPVVVLTTSSAEADVGRAYDLKANCYVQKPSHFDALQQVVRCIDEFWIGTALVPTG